MFDNILINAFENLEKKQKKHPKKKLARNSLYKTCPFSTLEHSWMKLNESDERYLNAALKKRVEWRGKEWKGNGGYLDTLGGILGIFENF